jgi:hypothetical protein
MRALLLVSSLVVGGATLAPSMAQAQSCPKDASAASYVLWAANTLRDNVTGTHPCGRRLTCIPGIVGSKPTRKCRWL